MNNRLSEDVAAKVAGKCISDTLGVEIAPNDIDGRQGAYDVALTYRGRTVAVEVKRVVDPRHQAAGAMSSALGYTRHSALQYLWMAYLVSAKRWTRTLTILPDIIAELEHRGCRPETSQYRWRQDPEMCLRLHRLGVQALFPLHPTQKHPSGYYVLQAPWAGRVPDLDQAVASACELAKGPLMVKLRRQLSDAETDERHAFLIYGSEYMEAIPFSEAGRLPRTSPDLPDGIQGLWLSTLQLNSPTVAWVPRLGWIRAAQMRWPQ